MLGQPLSPHRRALNATVCKDGTNNPGPPAVQAGGPGGKWQAFDYCWPMNLPLMLMLSSSTMLEPVSGPPSSTR